jgi:hypothetical protein
MEKCIPGIIPGEFFHSFFLQPVRESYPSRPFCFLVLLKTAIGVAANKENKIKKCRR